MKAGRFANGFVVCLGLAVTLAETGLGMSCHEIVASSLANQSSGVDRPLPQVEWLVQEGPRTKILARGDYIHAEIRPDLAQGQSNLRMGFISRIEGLADGDVRIVLMRQVSSWRQIRDKQIGEINHCYEFRLSQLKTPGFVYDFTDEEFDQYIAPLYLPVRRLAPATHFDQSDSPALLPSFGRPSLQVCGPLKTELASVSRRLIEPGDFVVFKNGEGKSALDAFQLYKAHQNHGIAGDIGAWVHHISATYEPEAGFRVQFVVTPEVNYIESGYDDVIFSVQIDPEHSYLLEDRHIRHVPRTPPTFR